MKKLFILLMLIASLSSYAQITLENTYPTGSVIKDYVRLVKLSSSGYKYAANNNSVLTLYNLNHTVFRTIPFPTFPNGLMSSSAAVVRTYYISEELFNTNPSDVEYLLFYTDTNSVGHIYVYDEIGTVLFSKDTVTILGSAIGYLNEDFISYTPSGCKMVISARYSGAASVYSLPGFLPCHDCTNGVVSTGIPSGSIQEEKISNYPNPSIDQTKIEYNFPPGTTSGDIVFYDMRGQEIKRFNVTNAFQNITVSTTDMQAGTYYYQLEAQSGFKAGKKMIVIK
jgi:hypothetical protein